MGALAAILQGMNIIVGLPRHATRKFPAHEGYGLDCIYASGDYLTVPVLSTASFGLPRVA